MSSTAADLKYRIKQIISSLLAMPDVASEPITQSNAEALTERYRFSDALPYRGYDTENHFAVMDDGEKPSIGLGIEVLPAVVAGEDLEAVMENIYVRCPDDTFVQTVLHSSNDVYLPMQRWLDARLEHTADQPLLREMSVRRHKFLTEAAFDKSLLKSERTHTRYTRGYIFLRVPFNGEIRDPAAVDGWIRNCIELREAVSGILTGGRIAHQILEEEQHRRLLMQLLNPHFKPETLDSGAGDYKGFPDNLVRKDSRISVKPDGQITFGGGDLERSAVAITVDSFPEEMNIQTTRMLTGDIFNREDKIVDPYWLWTAVHVMNPDDAKDMMTKKLGLVNRQTMSESAWFRSMAQHLYDRRDNTMQLMAATEQRHQIVRMATGIIVFPKPDDAMRMAESICSMWRKAGFQASIEKYISLPIFLASLPYGYHKGIDQNGRGLSRMEVQNSYVAGCATPIAADWRGHDLGGGGPTYITRRGQLSSISLMEEETNYNLSVVAQSGSGKSFASSEWVCDFLSRGGIVRIIDAGRSYQRLAGLVGGQVVEFNPKEPKSINPFWGISDPIEANENIPMWRDTIELMAFPRGAADSWVYQQIEDAVGRVWSDKGAEMGVSDIYDYFMSKDDERCINLADQLKPYATGRLAPWFNGKPEVQFSAKMTILELDGLNSDKTLRTVVLALVINMIIRDMYQYEKKSTDRLVPKGLLVDEAWDLMGKDSGNAGRFIEEAARRCRKYNGSLITITQSYSDYFASSSAEAALTNSAWRCSLAQSGQSIRVAEERNCVPGGSFIIPLLKTVKRGPGFSELHITNSAGLGEVFRLITDSFSYWTYTTHPDDKNKLAALISDGMSEFEAITHLADK